MRKKFGFYEKHGVEEYYIYDPEKLVFKGWTRSGGRLHPLKNTREWVSPILDIRFEMPAGKKLAIFGPDGEEFLSPLERQQLERERAEKAERKAEDERSRSEKAEREAEAERKKVLKLAEKLLSPG